MDTKAIHECTIGALEGRTTFPETVRTLLEMQVERYYADLVRMEKVFYARNGETSIERLSFEGRPSVADAFDETGVKTAIKSIQQREIDYSEFLRRIMAHGCASYVVYLQGRFAAYYGRRGEEYIERFPEPKS